MSQREIVIIGGGVGGTLVANMLVRKLDRRRAHITGRGGPAPGEAGS